MFELMLGPIICLFTVCTTYVVSASVPETINIYSCQEGSHVLMWAHASRDTDCEQSWTAESFHIGSFVNGRAECHGLCINLSAGEIEISSCLNATLTVICVQEHVNEYRIHFLGIQNNHLPLQNVKKRSHYGAFAGFTLLMLTSVGLAIKYYISGHL